MNEKNFKSHMLVTAALGIGVIAVAVAIVNEVNKRQFNGSSNMRFKTTIGNLKI